MDGYTLTIRALLGALTLADGVLERRVLSLLPALVEARARHWTKGAHGYFTGSYSDGAGGGGSGGKGLDKSAGSGIIKVGVKNMLTVDVDELVPCLKDSVTGEILPTEVREMKRSQLKGFTEKSGWNDDWANRPPNELIFGVFLKNDAQPQGLVSIRNDRGGVYIASASSAPWNNKLETNGKPKYIGVGGHLFAIAAEQSVKNGYGGTIYGYAVNREVLQHYVEHFGAVHFPLVHEYQFIIDPEPAQRLIDTYNYERS